MSTNQSIEEGDVVLFRHTGREHQVSYVKSHGFILCGMPSRVVQASEIQLVRKAEPIVNQYAGMSEREIRDLIAARLGLSR